MKDRQESVRQALRDAAAEFISREAGPQSLVTVTRTDISSDFSYATVYLSVLPDEKAKAALDFANRTVKELKEFIETRVRLPRVPRIEFVLDRGEKNRQALDELSQ